MLSCRRSIILTTTLFTFFPFSFGQFSSFVDAPTRRATVTAHSGTLEGAIIEKEAGKSADEKIVTITFIFTNLPSVFFDNYDFDKKCVVLDFYDTRIGESLLDTLKEFPITTSIVENTQIDLNKDVAGLRPDFRDVVRISLLSEFNFPYEIEEKFGVIIFKFTWNKSLQRKLSRRKKAIFWKLPLALAAGAGIFFYVYSEYLAPTNTPIPTLINDELVPDNKSPPRPALIRP